MSGRIVARTLSAAVLGALLVVSGTPAVLAAPKGPHGHFEDVIDLPNGFQPEGIAIGPRATGYVGSLATGDVYVFNVRTGEEIRTLDGPDTPSPSVGLKIDKRGRLFIAGGPTGEARVVDATTGELLENYQLTSAPTFVNDVVVTRDAAWFTDSQQAQLYKLPLGPGGAPPDDVEVVPLSGEWEQVDGFNANGIAQTPNRQALLVIQSATGILFRVDPETGEATAVDLGGLLLPNGDGLLVVGRTLYVVQNQLNKVAVIRLNAAGTSGEFVEDLTDSDFQVPTTIARFGKGLYLPNARFGTPTTPDTPYSVVRIER